MKLYIDVIFILESLNMNYKYELYLIHTLILKNLYLPESYF